MGPQKKNMEANVLAGKTLRESIITVNLLGFNFNFLTDSSVT